MNKKKERGTVVKIEGKRKQHTKLVRYRVDDKTRSGREDRQREVTLCLFSFVFLSWRERKCKCLSLRKRWQTIGIQQLVGKQHSLQNKTKQKQKRNKRKKSSLFFFLMEIESCFFHTSREHLRYTVFIITREITYSSAHSWQPYLHISHSTIVKYVRCL